MALAWAFEHFVAAFSERAVVRSALRSAARIVVFPAIFFDRFLARKAGSYVSGSAYYFFGRKCDRILSDHEILAFYKKPVR